MLRQISYFREDFMSYRDQKKYLEILKKFERNFDRQELEEYKMFMKRDKDEEEFDTISMKNLKKLYDKYNVPVEKKNYDAFFKKKDE
jgi:hypothetical protein